MGKTKFRRFFFLQRHKYIEPLFNYTFWCCTKGSKVKSSAIDIISFVLMQADSVEEHLDVINTAIGRTISFLDQTIDAKKQIAHE